MIELSSCIIMSGPKEGSTNASNGRVISPFNRISAKRTYPIILRDEPSAWLIAPAGTAKI